MKTLLALVLLTLGVVANAASFNWQSSRTGSWVAGSFSNNTCTYSYKIGSLPVVGPLVIENVRKCSTSIKTISVNGERHTTVVVNGTVVFQD